jgi:hypothetical protein
MQFRIIAAAFLSLCGIAAAQDRVIITDGGKGVTIGSKKSATTLPMEKATYLGVATSPVSAAIREQLKLQRGIGVVVERVERDSPAEQAGVKQYDILEKFGDQLLVDGKQLAILVRLNEPGASIPLTVVRQGQRQQINVTLTEKMVTVVPETTLSIGSTNNVIDSGTLTIVGDATADSPLYVPNVVRNMKSLSTSVSFVDGEVYNIRKENGSTLIRISDKQQNVLYEGPANTPEDLQAIPADYQGKAKLLLGKANGILSPKKQ